MKPSNHFSKLNTEEGFLNSEVGFIDFILAPQFEVANSFSGYGLSPIMDRIRKNRDTYDDKRKAIQKSKDETAKK